MHYYMSTKITGAEWKRFYTDKAAWPTDSYHEDEYMEVNGKPVDAYEFDSSKVEDSDRITLSGGIWFRNQDCDGEISLEDHFKRWRKSQSIEFISVQAPKKKAYSIRTAIRLAGGKVL